MTKGSYQYLPIVIALSLISFQVQAQEVEKTTTTTTTSTMPSGKVIEKKVIVTTVPSPKETIVIPTGYANCFTIKAGWYQDVWIADHQVCQYSDSPNGVAWVDGYWACNQYDLSLGNCTNWEWKAAHWEKTFTAY